MVTIKRSGITNSACTIDPLPILIQVQVVTNFGMSCNTGLES